MSVSQTNVIVVERPVSLFEAFLLSLATHAAILVILSLLGLLSMLTERPAERNPDREVKVHFTVAPESVEEAPSEPGDASPSDLPPMPDTAASDTEPADAAPDEQAPASLDRAQQLIVPVPPGQPVLAQQEPPADLPVPADQAETEADSEGPSSDGLPEGVDQGAAGELDVEAAEPVDAPESEPDLAVDTSSSAEAGVETELDLPETDHGDFASPEQPGAQNPAEPPVLGRPLGPSLDERISDFSRAVQRAREAVPPQSAQAPRNVFEPDWPSLPPTGQALGNMVFESGDYDWTEYQRQIYWIIWRTWHSRLFARVDDFEKWAQQNDTWYMEHFNGVRFTIESNGEISSIVLETESGSVPFDLSAVEGLDEAVLPPLPDDFPRDSETVHAQFIGQGPIAHMRRGLQRYRDAGVF